MSVDVLFLCPHHAAKSVIAAATFNRLAEQRGLPWRADSGGTEPSETVMPVVVSMLAKEGMDVSEHHPRRVTADELQSAGRVISMGCLEEALGVSGVGIEHWSDIPAVSVEPEKARQAILDRVERLMDELGV